MLSLKNLTRRVNTCFEFSFVMYLCVIFTDIPEDAVNEDSDDEEKANPDERISSMLWRKW